MEGKTQWYTLDETTLLKILDTNREQGLSDGESLRRLKQEGKNVLQSAPEPTLFIHVLRQFKSPLVFVLLLAGIGTSLLNEVLDTIVISLALLINVIVGTLQEERASRAFQRLNSSQEKFATIIREGRKKVIRAEEVVQGDVILLQAGMYVPADMRLLSTKELSMSEAALTGEWVPTGKEAKVITENRPVSSQENMAWMGTFVAGGTGEGVVVSVGRNTELGLIAATLGPSRGSRTPLQENIHAIARLLLIIVIIATFGIFIAGALSGEALGEMLLVAIAVAVATIPEGLPAAVTIVLALGMEAILSRGGLVRNLLAAETLGTTTFVLTDKTGTLTRGEMRLASVYPLERLDGTDGESENMDETTTLRGAIFASDAFVELGASNSEEPLVRGKPMEVAILLGGIARNLVPENLFKEEPRIDFLPFESKRRFAASLHEKGRDSKIYFSGSPESLLHMATHINYKGKEKVFVKKDKALFESALSTMTRKGMRMLGVAFAPSKIKTESEFTENSIKTLTHVTFLGILAFHDPVRTDVAKDIATVRAAGARVVMLTGDNGETALSIALETGIAGEGSRAVLGTELESLSDGELLQMLRSETVFGRVLPTEKLRIARVLKDAGEVVAMTGDGVNDAPALRAAHIGVAIGSGTEVAKEASDLVLLTNSFSVIVAAIEEGRRIIDNLKKIIGYLLSTGLSEILLIGGAIVAGVPLPILPTQILWANIVEEGFMSFPFAFEPKEPDIMKRSPRSHTTRTILTKPLMELLFITSAVSAFTLLALYFWLLSLNLPISEIRTFMFAALSLESIFFAFSFKSLRQPLYKINLRSNRYLLLGLSGSISLLFLALFFPPLRTLLSLEPLSALNIFLLFCLGILNLLTIETAKWFLWRGEKE